METVVEMDVKGRIVIPSDLRRRMKTKRMIVREADDHLELIPLPDPRSLKGKYRLEGRMDEIEELQEQKISERI